MNGKLNIIHQIPYTKNVYGICFCCKRILLYKKFLLKLLWKTMFKMLKTYYFQIKFVENYVENVKNVKPLTCL